MDNLNIIDRFMQTFIRYIDGGFGLLNGDVVALTTVLIGIDVTLAGLSWALDPNADLPARLIRKTLYVGAFAYIIGNFRALSAIVFASFSTLGLNATGTGLTAGDLLRPGRLAGTGFTAAWPLLKQAGDLMGFTSFFDNVVTIAVLLVAWLIVVLAFFILAVQLFITVLEYKLTALAGFVLVPFALWNRTAFLAERVLGNVVSSGVKVMVLAVIVGIGSTLFSSFTIGQSQTPSLVEAMSLVLAALTLFGLGIFGPALATGLVAGAPQLGAGAVIGTAGAVASAAFLTGGAALGAMRAGAGGLAALRAGSSMGGASASAASAASAAGQGASAMGGSPASAGSPAAAGSAMPPWARRLQAEQRRRHHRQATAQAIREGDRPGAPANPELDEKD